MMDIKKIQSCNSNDPYHIMFVASQTTPNTFYTITVIEPEDEPKDWICSCPSWLYRSTCKHLTMVTPCRWTEDDEKQNEPDVCPRCGGPTHEEWIIE